MQKRHYRFLLGLAVVGLLLSLTGPLTAQAAPNTYSDLKGHWAAGPINKWNEWGLVGGYSNGTFGVSRPVTRAEFIAFVNRAFGYTKTTEISFTDVKPNSWFAGDIAKAIGMGYMTGNADGTFRPNQPLSRLEAAQVLYKVMRLESITEDHLAQYKDLAALNGEDKAMLNAVVAKGYFGGYPDKTIRPQSTITRAEMIAILSRAAGEIMNSANTFGPETGTVTLPGNATISKSGTTLRNTVVKGDLYITEGVGNGDVYLMDVVVEGRTIVAGGGSNSVHAGGQTRLAQVKITYPDGTTRLVVEGEASAGEVEFQTPGIVDNSQSTSDIRPNIVINVPPGATVEIIGDVNDVTVASAGTNLQMGEGSTASNVTATESAQGSTLNIQGNVTGTLANNAPNATTTVASTATVANVTTSESATGSTTNVQGKVTGALTVNAPNATAEVTGTVNQMTTGTSATGSNVSVTGTVTTLALNAPQANTTITGTVTTVQANASGQLNLSAGANVGTLEVAPGTTGVAVDREQGSTVGTIVVPPDTTIDLDGKDQTGPISGGGTGGGTGGGDPQPTQISISGVSANVVEGSTNRTLPASSVNSEWVFNLTTEGSNVLVNGFSLSTNVSGGSYTLQLNSLTWVGKTVNLSRTISVTNNNLGLQTLVGSAIDAVLGTTGVGNLAAAAAMGDDISLGMLRQFSGNQLRFSGTISASGYQSLPVTLVVNVQSGADEQTLVFDTKWARITINRGSDAIAMLVKGAYANASVGTQTFAGLTTEQWINYIKGVNAGELAGVQFSADNVSFTSLAISDIKGWVLNYARTKTGDSNLAWSAVTMQDLHQLHLYIKLPSTTVYEVVLTVPAP